jgi:hypothetical protein
VSLSFEWDHQKATNNLKKHGVSFEEARTVFADPLSSTAEDHSQSGHGEIRSRIIGQSERRRTLIVIHVDQGDTIRLISAREATPIERELYEES